MWLLNCDTNQLESFEGEDRPPYAILSHRWEGKEVLFQDVMDGRHTELQGWQKIKACCEQAKRDGLDYVWADTCCIDKRSSAELSEAINSMYKWYEQAQVCYAYLADVARDQIPMDGPELADSIWFTRGWTLQELLAPKSLEFYDCHWKGLGTKKDHAEAIKNRTGIPTRALIDFESQRYCIAQKMSWAAGRKTTRVEDRTYSLLGLLDINMPLLYGEANRAFERLQNELIRTSTDDSIYAWSLPQLEPSELGVLASSPDCYRWESSLEFERYSTQTSVSKEGLTGQFHVSPFCCDVIAAVVGYVGPEGSLGPLTEVVVMFLVKVGQNHYRRVLLDGKACEILKIYGYPRHYPAVRQQRYPGRTITVSFGTLVPRSSNTFYSNLDSRHSTRYYLILGLLSPANPSKQSNKRSSLRKRFGKMFVWGQDMSTLNRPILIGNSAREEDSGICLLLEAHGFLSQYPVLIVFARNFASEPTALAYVLSGKGGKVWDELLPTDWSDPVLPEVYQNRSLTVSTRQNKKLRSGWYTATDGELLKSAFFEIDKEMTVKGARLQHLGPNIKVAFVPAYTGGHRVFLAFKEYDEEDIRKIPREWLYPPTGGGDHEMLSDAFWVD